MNPDEIMYEWIDRYLNGQLEGEELSVFTAKLESDVEFATLVQNQKAANTIILGNRLSMVKQLMDADFKSADNKDNSTKWGLGGLLGASVLICSLFYFSDKTVSDKPSSNVIDTQKQSTTISSSNPDQKSSEHIPQSSYKKTNTSTEARIDTVKTSLPNVHAYSGLEKNPLAESNNHNSTQVLIDAVPVKNQLPSSINMIQNIDLCSGIVIEGILTVDAACTHKDDGEIHIIEKSLKGGRSPYIYVLVNSANDTVRQNTTSFVSLTSGQYKLFFEDANNCSSAYKKPLYVNEKSCTQRTQSFSPHAGEKFTYPVLGTSDAQITIYNRGGQTVYKTNLSKGESGLWDGTNQNGQLLPTGMYIYIIEYVSGTKETGEVVIF